MSRSFEVLETDCHGDAIARSSHTRNPALFAQTRLTTTHSQNLSEINHFHPPPPPPQFFASLLSVFSHSYDIGSAPNPEIPKYKSLLRVPLFLLCMASCQGETKKTFHVHRAVWVRWTGYRFAIATQRQSSIQSFPGEIPTSIHRIWSSFSLKKPNKTVSTLRNIISATSQRRKSSRVRRKTPSNLSRHMRRSHKLSPSARLVGCHILLASRGREGSADTRERKQDPES